MLITHKTVEKGERVLILGASGGVGTGCVILAKMLGAEVIACSSSEDKLRFLKEIGADEVIDYTKTDFSKWAVEKYGKPQRRTYEGGVDVGDQFHRWGHLVAVAALREARRQDFGLRRDRGTRPEGRPTLHLDLRAEDHRLEQLLRREFSRR